MYRNKDEERDSEKQKLANLTHIQLQQLIIHLKSELSLYKSIIKELKNETSRKRINNLKDENEKLLKERQKFEDKILEIISLLIPYSKIQFDSSLANHPSPKENIVEKINLYFKEKHVIKNELVRLHETISLLFGQVHQNTEQIQNLEMDVTRLSENENQFIQEMEHYKQTIDCLNKQKQLDQKQINTLEQTISQLSDHEIQLIQQIKHYKQTIERLNEQKQINQEHIQTMEQTVSQLSTQEDQRDQEVELYKQKIDHLNEQNRLNQDQIKRLEQTISQLSAQENQRNEEIELYKQTIESLNGQNQLNQDQIKQLEQTVSQLSAQENQRNQEIEQHKQTIDHLNEQKQLDQEQMKKLEQTISQLSEQESHYKQEKENDKQTIILLREQEQQAKKQIANLENTVTLKENQLTQEKNAFNKSLVDLTIKESNYMDTIERLNHTVKSLLEQQKNDKQEIENLQTIMKNEQESLNILTRNEEISHDTIDTPSNNNTNLNNHPKLQNKQSTTFRFSNDKKSNPTHNPFPMNAISPSQPYSSLNNRNHLELSKTILPENYFLNHHNKNIPQKEDNQMQSIEAFYQKHPIYKGKQNTVINPFTSFTNCKKK